MRNPLDRHRSQPRSRELQRERDAVQTAADFGDGDGVVVGDPERRLRCSGAVDKELHRGKRGDRIGVYRGGRRRRCQWRQRIDALATHIQGFAARHQDCRARSRPQQALRELGARLHEVLAVVEDQQQVPVPHELQQRVDDREPGLFLHAQHRRHRLRHETRIVDWSELDQPRAVGKRVEGVGRHLERQPGLAEAAATQQCQQACLGELFSYVDEFAFAPDEGRELLRQVVRRCFKRAQRRKLLPQCRMHHLVDALWLRKVTQPDTPEIEQRDPFGQTTSQQCGDGLRQQDLSTMGGAHHARGAIDGVAEVVVVATCVDPGVQSAAHAQGDAVGSRRVGERPLQLHGCAERVEWVGKDGQHAVAGRLDDAAAAVNDAPLRNRVMARQRILHALRRLLPQPRAAFDVGEQVRGDGRRLVHAGAPDGGKMARLLLYWRKRQQNSLPVPHRPLGPADQPAQARGFGAQPVEFSSQRGIVRTR